MSGADFRSALYLGMRHSAPELAAWTALTLGKPAALQEPPGAVALARQLAELQGCEVATLLPSTLHLFRDVFGMLARGALVARPSLLVDAAAYPIARWGVEWAALQGVPVRLFGHGDVAQLAGLAQRAHSKGCTPVVLADGYTPGDAGTPPLRAYASIVAPLGGWLVLDDTQALGVLGCDGGGSVRLHCLQRMPVLTGASLAKGFGVPLAVLAGPAWLIDAFERHSESRVHASPPSVVVIAAARHALHVNTRDGPRLRRRLLARIRQLRRALAVAGLACHGGAFPVQLVPLQGVQEQDALALAEQVQGILLGTKNGLALGLLLRADHGERDVARVAAALGAAMVSEKTRRGGDHAYRFRDIAVFGSMAGSRSAVR